jgi:hypothetical protein
MRNNFLRFAILPYAMPEVSDERMRLWWNPATRFATDCAAPIADCYLLPLAAMYMVKHE